MSGPLRIALFTTFYPPHNFGGDGIYVRRLAHELTRLGCQVTVVYDKDAYRALAPNAQKDPPPLSEPAGLTVHALESGLGIISPLLTQQLGAPVVQRKRIEAILRDGFDVIHYHNASLVGGPGLLSLGPEAIRLYTAHEHWLACPTHILWRDNKEVCTQKRCISCQITYRRPPQLWRFTRLLERHIESIDTFIALSQSSAENHKRFGFPREMEVMPSFLPDAEIDPGPDEPVHSRPYIFAAGRLERIKGLQDIIPVFTPDMPADLLIAGSGDFEGELRNLAAGNPRIHFLGRMPPEALSRLYRQSLALVAPSKCYEVFPLVALEAFRQGAPMIARNLGAYPEIVAKSGAGYLFDAPHEIVPIVKALAAAPDERERLGKAAEDAFRHFWSKSASLSAYFHLIANCAEKRGMTKLRQKCLGLAKELTQSPDLDAPADL